ncbi:MAG: hypothetical protein GY868_08155 [Deltaproteobacteria bacterium]|nr:hypothetical protein [Deltaproteobacteria bacterium]
MSATLLELIPDEIMQQWDREDYKILSPEELEDAPVIKIVLINQNETEITINLPLGTPAESA